jgi:hypothetical protein
MRFAYPAGATLFGAMLAIFAILTRSTVFRTGAGGLVVSVAVKGE